MKKKVLKEKLANERSAASEEIVEDIKTSSEEVVVSDKVKEKVNKRKKKESK